MPQLKVEDLDSDQMKEMSEYFKSHHSGKSNTISVYFMQIDWYAWFDQETNKICIQPKFGFESNREERIEFLVQDENITVADSLGYILPEDYSILIHNLLNEIASERLKKIYLMRSIAPRFQMLPWKVQNKLKFKHEQS
ncbi:MAG: hypothetical protein HWD61_04080 [Parachlamydiaceae bacterium]|nr:MAG: hypothetical protein HWD61_04080 [Parachlamydiaceae bacterium]